MKNPARPKDKDSNQAVKNIQGVKNITWWETFGRDSFQAYRWMNITTFVADYNKQVEHCEFHLHSAKGPDSSFQKAATRLIWLICDKSHV